MKKTILILGLVTLTLGSNGLSANESNYIKGATSSLNFNAPSNVDVNSFCKAVMQGDLTMVQRMISLGEDVNQKSLGMTPAMFAARYNKVEILTLLIEHGADLKLKSNQGFDAKKYAELAKATEALAVIETALGS